MLNSSKLGILVFLQISLIFFLTALCLLFLIQHGDIESHVGLRKKESKFFSCCQWNVGSLIVHNKILLLVAHTSIQKHDITCIPETYFDSSVPIDIRGLSVEWYNLVRVDYPDKIRRGDICMYIKVDLTLQAQDTSYFLQCLHCEVSIQSQRGYVVVTYRSPSQYNLKFKSYLSNFERFFEHINKLNLSFQ